MQKVYEVFFGGLHNKLLFLFIMQAVKLTTSSLLSQKSTLSSICLMFFLFNTISTQWSYAEMDSKREIDRLNAIVAELYLEGKYAKALQAAEKLVEIVTSTLSEEHPDYATSLNNLAVFHRTMGAYNKAKPLFNQALEIRKKILGEEHPEYAQSLNNLAWL